jgi:hypothetical protein
MGNAWLLTKFATRPVALKKRSRMVLIRIRYVSTGDTKTTTSSA